MVYGSFWMYFCIIIFFYVMLCYWFVFRLVPQKVSSLTPCLTDVKCLGTRLSIFKNCLRIDITSCGDI